MTTEQQLQRARERLSDLDRQKYTRMSPDAARKFDQIHYEAQQAVIDLERQLSEDKSRTLMGAIGK